ncbi:transglycosylase domain-containing protein [Sinomonas albida]|uniref:transglycosylase domain-containing protein n=1 Tax=Sinomonas albida TaxID=369942 RepID=UPI0010A7AF82|nr:transglycosylase domain-containing protein [Sinomonas albida]
MDPLADNFPPISHRVRGRRVVPLGPAETAPPPQISLPEEWEPRDPEFDGSQDRRPAGRGRRPADRPRRRGRVRRVLKVTGIVVVVAFVASILTAIAYNWITPPRTSYMLQAGEPTVYQYVSLDHISRNTIAAVIAHEDEELGSRVGAFTEADFQARAQAFIDGQPDPSGSTVPQQLVKNIFLWPSHDALRKAIEAPLSEEFDLLLPKQRIAELYLNYAQFGPKLFGICAASWYYYNTPPSQLNTYESAQLMGVLPDPDNVRRAPGGGLDISSKADPMAVDLINGAANVWLPRQLAGMGGWQAAVATIGIKDEASAHAATEGGPDGCSTMPQSVTERLKSEGAK